MTKLEIMQEMNFNLKMKSDKTDFDRLYIIQTESNIKELEWVLEIMQPEDNEETQRDFMDEMKSDMKEEEMENDSEDTLSI